jgi:hypothetical protein
VQGALEDGRDALLCLYGVSNAGKTYTMFGTDEVRHVWCNQHAVACGLLTSVRIAVGTGPCAARD